MRKHLLKICLTYIFLLISCSTQKQIQTTSVKGDADDCAFWINHRDPSSSILIGNDKTKKGALYVWNLEGKLIYKSNLINRPVGVDVRYGMKLNDELIDIVVCGVRSSNELKVFKIDPIFKKLIDITTDKKILTHLEDTYGIALYKRKKDNKIFVFVSSKKTADIHQILLENDSFGKIEGKLVRKFGKNDQKSFIEGMVSDDDLGYLYCSDEKDAILKYIADPDKKNNQVLLKFAKKDDIVKDREGLTLYKNSKKTGYLILSSQGNSTFKIYKREDKNSFIKTIKIKGIKNTDGLDVTNVSILPNFPNGAIALHNDLKKNFILLDWKVFLNNE